MDFKIELNDAQIQEVAGAAILAQLTPETRDRIIASAVAEMLRPGSGRFSSTERNQKSAVQEAFERALYARVDDLAREMIEKDESIRAKLRDLIVEAVDRLVTDNRGDTVKAISAAIAKGISGY